MIRVNLLPYLEERKKESVRRQTSILVLTTVCVLVACAAAQLYVMNEAWNYDEQIATARADIEGLKKKIGEVDKFKADKVALETKLGIIERLNQNKFGPIRMMDELSNAVSADMWLKGLTVKDSKLELAGVALDNPTIANFMTDLESRKSFGQVNLQVTENTDVHDLVLKTFTLTTPVKGIGS